MGRAQAGRAPAHHSTTFRLRTVRAAANPVHGQRGLDGGVSGQTGDARRCDQRGARLFGTKRTPDGRRRGHPGASVSHDSPPTTSVLADPHTSCCSGRVRGVPSRPSAPLVSTVGTVSQPRQRQRLCRSAHLLAPGTGSVSPMSCDMAVGRAQVRTGPSRDGLRSGRARGTAQRPPGAGQSEPRRTRLRAAGRRGAQARSAGATRSPSRSTT